jgi:hypothetical protein
MNSLFNSTFEMELRVLLLLSQTRRALSKEEIVDFDFITIYSADYGIGEENLHGENRFKFGEFASRNEAVTEALKETVTNGLVSVKAAKGFYYCISQSGLEYVNSLENAYSVEYRETARKVLQQYANYSEDEIHKEIMKSAAESRRIDHVLH